MKNPLTGLIVYMVQEKFGNGNPTVHTFLSFNEDDAKTQAWEFVEKMRKEEYDNNGSVSYSCPQKTELHLEE